MWISITEADVLTVLSGPELEAYRNAAKATGQTDPVAPVIAQVTALARGYVGACGRNRLGESGTIPEKLLAPALDLLALRLPQRVRLVANETRKSNAQEALRLFERVANCQFDIEEPLVADTEVSSVGPSPTIAARTKRFGSAQQEGV
jgi:hypothetical protein